MIGQPKVRWFLGLLQHGFLVWTFCFDTDFVSEMKLTKLSLIHSFESHTTSVSLGVILFSQNCRQSRHWDWLCFTGTCWLQYSPYGTCSNLDHPQICHWLRSTFIASLSCSTQVTNPQWKIRWVNTRTWWPSREGERSSSCRTTPSGSTSDISKWHSTTVEKSRTRPEIPYCWTVRCRRVEFRARSHCALFSDCDCNFVFACNGLDRSWWCCRSHIVWTLLLRPVQPICCNKKNRHRNQKKTYSVNEPLVSQIAKTIQLYPYDRTLIRLTNFNAVHSKKIKSGKMLMNMTNAWYQR